MQFTLRQKTDKRSCYNNKIWKIYGMEWHERSIVGLIYLSLPAVWSHPPPHLTLSLHTKLKKYHPY